jgi:CBS domain-containing protein
MPVVRDLIRTKGGQVWSIAPDAIVLEALQLMAEKQVGALLVMRGDNIRGIISERDCIRKLDLQGRTARQTKVSEIMTSNVLYVEASESLEECMAIMTEKRIRHLPVFDEGHLVGLISIGDVLKQINSEQKIIISHLEHYISGEGN